MTAPMPQTNFGFVGRVWPALLNDCREAERNALSHPVVSCFYSRRVLERVVRHIWEFRKLGALSDKSTFGRLKDDRFISVSTATQLTKMHFIRVRGNDAVHEGKQPITPQIATKAVMQLFDVLSWATARHSTHPEAGPTAPFNQQFLKVDSTQPSINHEQLKKLAAGLKAKDAELNETALLLDESEQERLAQAEAHAKERAFFVARSFEAEEKRATTEAELIAAQEKLKQVNAERDAEIERLRAELRDELAARAGSGLAPTLPPTISEAQTRRDLIDPTLAASGFRLGDNATTEYPVKGMPISTESPHGNGFVDYVLWDDDGQPLAVVEAKRSNTNLSDGAIQARLYADCLEAEFGRRPIIFCTNGHLIEMTDDAANLPGSGLGYPTRPVEGYPSAEQLRQMINRRSTRKHLANVTVDPMIAGRDYQQEMIRRVTESLEHDIKRRTLLVMATGTGKTRVAIATSKLLRGSNWVGNVLFLADRTALVDQAHDNFVEHYPESAPVNLLRDPNGVGGVYISTYQTMMGLINDDGETPAKFRSFDFDLIIIDEAHRSVYHRFKRILDYFDAYVLGLTATPKAEVHRNTYQLFDIDGKNPTGAYTLEQAIEDKYLVPPQVITQDSLFLRSGVRYEDLDIDEQQRWDEAEWGSDEDGNPLDPPDGISAAEINSRLYNRDTIRKVLSTLVTEGIKIEGGDRLGKTIIFARTQKHASLIKEEFDHYFPLYAGESASVITHSTRYANAELNRFKNPTSGLNVAISVDMLDTGVDVPEVVNLVFFKPVYSSTKFWQMMGRGTRLRPNLFGDGIHKDKFRVFDFCGNARFFMEQQPEDLGIGRQVSLSEKLFLSRAALVSLLDQHDNAPVDFRNELSADLHQAVSQIAPSHIQVRPIDRPILEHYQQPQAWESLSEKDLEILGNHVASLPMKTMDEKESAKRFDLLILQLQLGLLNEDSSWTKNRQRVEKIADELLTVSENLPFVAAASKTLEALLNSEWWEGVSVTELEKVRREIRDLVEFVPRHQRQVVVLDVEDEFGDIAEIDLPVEFASAGVNVSRVEEELRAALAEHFESLAMQKLRTARPLTDTDVKELESMVAEAGLEGIDEVRKSLGGDTIPAFVRRLVGLDGEAMRAEFADLLEGSTLAANQISFIRHVIKVLTNSGGLTIQEAFQESFYPYGRAFDLFQNDQALVLDLKSRLERINSAVEVI